MIGKRTRRLLFTYLGLVLALAALGSHNQDLFRYQWRLMDEKAELQIQVSELRARSANITGPLAVRQWALENGMVTTPEGRDAQAVYPIDPPRFVPTTGGMEIRTLWQ